MNIFFTADLHFDHKNVIAHCNRPWDTVEEMNEGLIERWNSVVRQDDMVWVLGDVCWKAKTAEQHMKRLRGKKHLVRGNHDFKNVVGWGGWESVSELKHYKLNKQLYVLCHYPLLSWKHAHWGSYHLHGHSHGSLKVEGTTRLDVGVDTHNWYPYEIDEVKKIMSKRTWEVVDHHE